MNTSNKIIDINKARAIRETKKRRKNPFERALVEEGEFVTIKPFKKIEIVEENDDGSADDHIDLSNRQ